MTICICCCLPTSCQCLECDVPLCWSCGTNSLCPVCMRLENARREFKPRTSPPALLILRFSTLAWGASLAKVKSEEITEKIERKR